LGRAYWFAAALLIAAVHILRAEEAAIAQIKKVTGAGDNLAVW
jgi:hypothetical protein